MQFLVGAVSRNYLAESIIDNSHFLSCLGNECLAVCLGVPVPMGLVFSYLLDLRVALQDPMGLMVDVPSKLRDARLSRLQEGFPDQVRGIPKRYRFLGAPAMVNTSQHLGRQGSLTIEGGAEVQVPCLRGDQRKDTTFLIIFGVDGVVKNVEAGR